MQLQIELGATQGDGATLRAHLVRLASGPMPQLDPRLAEVSKPLPLEAAPLLDVFTALANARASDAGIAWTEVEAWQRLRGVKLTTWELETIVAMDNAARVAIAEQRRKSSGGTQ